METLADIFILEQENSDSFEQKNSLTDENFNFWIFLFRVGNLRLRNIC